MDFVTYANEVIQERRREFKNGFLENLNPSKEELEKLYAKYLQKNQDKAS
jgi:hypothetical protein